MALGAPQGTWDVTVTIGLCDTYPAGGALAAPAISADVKIPAQSVTTLGQLGWTEVASGTAAATYTVTGSVVNPGSRTGNLTVTNAPIALPLDAGGNATAGIEAIASGSGDAETAGSAGSVTVTVGNFQTKVKGQAGTFPNPLTVNCTYASGVNTIPITIA